MSRNSGTRSGLLWEVERILKETKQLPKVLLMENVPEVIGSNFIKDFQEWEAFLTSLGYSNHTEILNAKHYGIPQNRQRAFMVSILGNYLYNFPQKIALDLRLRDMLEGNVDEKFYLSEKLFNFFVENHKKNKEKGNGFAFSPSNGESVAKCITTLAGNRMDDNFIDETKEYANYITWLDDKDPKKITEPSISIPEDTNLGYALAHEGDGVYINRPEQKRGVVQNQMIQTIKTSSNDIGVVVAGQFQLKEINNKNLRIRKLTPKECYRLMGFSDQAFDLAQANQSNSTLYHQAGDSIVVNVLMAIFKELL
jgi:DNA (cytosine-5)-methyltransferase 1